MILKFKILIKKIRLMISAYDCQLYTFSLSINAWNTVYNWMSTEVLTVISYWPCREVFHDDVIFFTTGCAFWNMCRVRKGVLKILTCLTLKLVVEIYI